MAMYKCEKCGNVVHSKCIISRSLFAGDGVSEKEAKVGGYLKRRVEREEGKNHKVIFTWFAHEDKTDEELFDEFKEVIAEIPEDVWKQYRCNHVFVCQSDECLFKCCKKGDRRNM
jgi:hypothetical protein